MNYLRRKLNDCPPWNLICTVRGKGYMLEIPILQQIPAGIPNHRQGALLAVSDGALSVHRELCPSGEPA